MSTMRIPCRSSSLKTAVRTTCARQTWCSRLIWTSQDRGPDKRPLVSEMSLLGSERRLFSPQTEALCDSQPPQAPGGGGAASEQTGERLQHQPHAALLKKPALLQPQHQGRPDKNPRSHIPHLSGFDIQPKRLFSFLHVGGRQL